MLAFSAIEMSGLNGGDGKSLTLDVLAGAVKDVGLNKNPYQTEIKVIELPDILHPTVKSGTVYLGNGHVSLIFQKLSMLRRHPKLILVNFIEHYGG